MKRILFLLIAATAILAAQSQRTTRRNLHARTADTTAEAAPTAAYDTVTAAGAAAAVEINGYDKPLRSRRETFFATNTGNKAVERIAFTISYFDTDGRLMHRASHNVPAAVPAGETRQIGLRSWDTQQAFYYERSTVSARAEQATPYRVTIAVDTVFLKKF